MTRIVQRNQTGPFVVDKASVEGEKLFICACGLSGALPFCDGSHKATRREPNARLVRYERRGEELVAEEVEVRPLPPAGPRQPQTA